MRPSPEAWVGCTNKLGLGQRWCTGRAGRLEGKGREEKTRPPSCRRCCGCREERNSRTERDFQLEISFCDRHSLRPLPGENVKAQAQAQAWA